MLIAITRPEARYKKMISLAAPGTVLQSLLSDRALIGLAMAFALFWLTSNGRQQFKSLYMQHLGASEKVIGLAYTYPALIEIPIMLWAE